MKKEKELFIDAYCWFFGVTRKQAVKKYRESLVSDPEFIQILIELYTSNFRKSFYAD